MAPTGDERAQRVWFKGPREPCWKCPSATCSASKNFACRVRCQLCDGRAPAEVFKAAKLADKKAKAEAEAKATSTPPKVESSRRDKELEDLRVQLKVLMADKDRRERERAEEMEEGGFTLSKTRAQKRKDKRQPAAAAKKPAQAPSTGSGSGTQPPTCTVADILDLDVDDEDINMQGVDNATGAGKGDDVSTKAQVDKLAKVVQNLTGMCEGEGEGSLLCQTRDAKVKELTVMQTRLKEEQAAAKPVWRPVQEIATKCRKKRALADKAKEKHDEVTAELQKLEQAIKDKHVEEAETRKAADELAREADLLDAEFATAQARLTVGNSKSSPAVQSITQCLLEYAENPSHEMLLAFQSAGALFANAKATTEARLQAAVAAGVAPAPQAEVANAGEAKVRDTLLEFTRQLQSNADTFIGAQKALQEKQSEAARHLASLQATRAQPAVGPPAVVPSDAPHPAVGSDGTPAAGGGSSSAASGAGGPSTDPAAQAIALAATAGIQAQVIAATAVSVPA